MCATAGFATYLSLVPFDFERMTIRQTLATFSSTAEHEIQSPVNFVANIILFVPFGLFGAGMLLRSTTKRGRYLRRCLALLVSSLALSFAIEVLQARLPSRIPSFADITAQTFGTLFGLSLWLAVAPRVLAWAKAADAPMTHDPLRTGLVLFVLARTLALLLPLDVTTSLSTLLEKYRRGGIILDPMKSIEHWQDLVPALASNLLLCGPIGYLAATFGAGTRQHVGHAALLGVAFVAFVEFAQVFVTSRTADIGDVITGGLGVVVGAWLATRSRKPAATAPVTHRPWHMVGLLAGLAVYVTVNWTPFDFVASGAFVRPRLEFVHQVPFYAYHLSPELQVLSDALLKVTTGVPIGLFACAVLDGLFGRRTRARSIFITASGTAFFSVVEVGQAFLPSRYPDTTDVLLALAGTWIGMRAAQALRISASR